MALVEQKRFWPTREETQSSWQDVIGAGEPVENRYSTPFEGPLNLLKALGNTVGMLDTTGGYGGPGALIVDSAPWANGVERALMSPVVSRLQSQADRTGNLFPYLDKITKDLNVYTNIPTKSEFNLLGQYMPRNPNPETLAKGNPRYAEWLGKGNVPVHPFAQVNLDVPKGWGGQLGDRLLTTSKSTMGHEVPHAQYDIDARYRALGDVLANKLSPFDQIRAEEMIGTRPELFANEFITNLAQQVLYPTDKYLTPTDKFARSLTQGGPLSPYMPDLEQYLKTGHVKSEDLFREVVNRQDVRRGVNVNPSNRFKDATPGSLFAEEVKGRVIQKPGKSGTTQSRVVGKPMQAPTKPVEQNPYGQWTERNGVWSPDHGMEQKWKDVVFGIEEPKYKMKVPGQTPTPEDQAVREAIDKWQGARSLEEGGAKPSTYNPKPRAKDVVVRKKDIATEPIDKNRLISDLIKQGEQAQLRGNGRELDRIRQEIIQLTRSK